jgi:sulfite reductase (ferredoxin)
MPPSETPQRETAAQRVERIKREKAPWSMLDDIRRYAREGFASIPADDLGVRFRAWGLYTQGDGRGTRGDEQPFFMMRLRTPNGLVNADMVRTVAELTDRYARGAIDITNRQNFQLHWLRIEDVPTVWEALARVGWTSQGACGDNTRTVTGCPLAGVEYDEILDASPIALEVDRFLNGNAEYANLPRKFKVTVTGCRGWCSYPEINDVGATAVRHDDGRIGFAVRVGGGLSTKPHLAVRLPAFVRPEQVRDVVVAAVGIFRDSDELRVNRAKARMKFLFLKHEWTAERFLAEVERRVGYALEPWPGSGDRPTGRRDHIGIRAQKQAGLFYAGLSISSGRITTAQLRHVADLAATYGDGTIRLTATQNIVVANIPGEKVPAFRLASRAAGLPLDGSAFQRGTVSCTGSEFCKLAITETKRFSIRLAEELEERVPGFSSDIRLHVTGCPNSCGQHWIADVGLQGVLMNVDGAQREGYDVFLGGSTGDPGRFARRVGARVLAQEVAPALARLFTAFARARTEDEAFGMWVHRVSDEGLREILGETPA